MGYGSKFRGCRILDVIFDSCMYLKKGEKIVYVSECDVVVAVLFFLILAVLILWFVSLCV